MRTLILIMIVAIYNIRPINLFATELRVDCDGGITYDTCAESNPNGTYSGGCPVINIYTVDKSKCTSGTTKWIRGVGYYSCNTCVTGASLDTNHESINGCDVYYQSCNCTTTATCTSGPWTTVRAGYESRTRSTALCASCKNTTEYRCAAGYWGNTTNGSSGCSQCEAGTTSPADSTSHSACCYPDGYSYTGSDTTGNYTITHNGKCCWA